MNKQAHAFGQSDIVRLSDEDAATALLEKAVTRLWEVVNELTRFRRTTRQDYRVTIFGSARIQPGSVACESVKTLATELTKMGCDIMSGGGPGLMQAGVRTIKPPHALGFLDPDLSRRSAWRASTQGNGGASTQVLPTSGSV
jgi:hypothetical protein